MSVGICTLGRENIRGSGVVSQRFFIAAFVVLAMATEVVAQANSAFAPPPVSAVRGVTDLNQAYNSPATIAPPPSNASGPVIDYSVTPTPTAGNAKPLEGGEIVAKIDGEIVLASDVLWQVQMVLEANKGRIPDNQIEDAKRALLRQHVIGLIDTKVLYADFKRKVPVENLPKIEENLSAPFEESEIPRLCEALQVKDREELEYFLKEYGTSLTDAKRQFVERTIAGEWLRQMAPKSKPVTHEELLAYYQAHASEYDFPAQVKWEELFIQFSRMNGDRTTAWQAITEMGNEVWEQVQQNPNVRGQVFTEIAKAKSHGITAGNGGFRDWTTRGALSSADIDTALFTLEIGQMSEVIESDLGFHIVRVLDRHEAGRKPFTEAQADITKILQNEEKKETIGVELKNLRDKSRIWTVFDGEFRGSEMPSRSRGMARQPE
jgi:hypothetical protein